MRLEYGLNQKVPFFRSFLFGLQWAAILLSSIIILGKVVGALHFAEPFSQVVYLQKLIFISAVMLLCQIYWGHRLPVVPGPAAVLLIGVIVSQGSAMSAIYSSILIGGVVVALLAATGLFRYIQRLFGPNVVGAVLLLIAFTLAPTIQKLILDPASGIAPLSNLCFAGTLIFLLFLGYRCMSGILKSTLVIWGMIAGSFFYLFIFPQYKTGHGISTLPLFGGFFEQMIPGLTIDMGVFLSFMVCFVALSVNDLGSIQSVNEFLAVADKEKRITRGMFLTGIGNIASGFFSVIGPVNYSLSPGIIASSGCASRFTLIPTGVIMLILAFSPAVIGFIEAIPSVVIGGVLAYVMASQVVAGFAVIFQGSEEKGLTFENGLVVGASVLMGTMVSFLPETAIQTLPPVLRPTLGNGFVVGVVSALVLEHLVFRNRR